MRFFAAAIVVLSLVASACGGASDTEPADGSTTEASVPAAEATGADGAAQPAEADAGEADVAFPVTIEHAFGSTTIDAEPTRVLTYGFADHSYALPMGVVPIAIRKNFDAQNFIVYPWAFASLDGSEPELIGTLEPSFEQIASLEPDVILAMNANIDERVYGLLSAIAPTVTRPADLDLQDVPWREMVETIGSALGRADAAASVTADLEEEFASVRARNPSFVGATATIAFATLDGRAGTYAPQNHRYGFLAELGFEIPAAVVAEPLVGTIIELGFERLDLLEADAVIWTPDDPAVVGDIATRESSLVAARERREIVLDPFLGQALTESSPLSMRYAIERLEEELAAALDGDPETVAASAVALYEAPGAATADEQAAMEAWRVLLDPAATIDEKRPHIADVDSLLGVFDEAVAAAEALGGIVIEPERAVITGDTAVVTFSAVVGEVAGPGLVANLDNVDGVWMARRDEVCGFVSLIGVRCPDAAGEG